MKHTDVTFKNLLDLQVDDIQLVTLELLTQQLQLSEDVQKLNHLEAFTCRLLLKPNCSAISSVSQKLELMFLVECQFPAATTTTLLKFNIQWNFTYLD